MKYYLCHQYNAMGAEGRAGLFEDFSEALGYTSYEYDSGSIYTLEDGEIIRIAQFDPRYENDDAPWVKCHVPKYSSGDTYGEYMLFRSTPFEPGLGGLGDYVGTYRTIEDAMAAPIGWEFASIVRPYNGSLVTTMAYAYYDEDRPWSQEFSIYVPKNGQYDLRVEDW